MTEATRTAEIEGTYPPICHGCGGPFQPMASNGPGSPVVMVCGTCDGDTLDAMWDYETTPAPRTRPEQETTA